LSLPGPTGVAIRFAGRGWAFLPLPLLLLLRRSAPGPASGPGPFFSYCLKAREPTKDEGMRSYAHGRLELTKHAVPACRKPQVFGVVRKADLREKSPDLGKSKTPVVN